MTSVTITSDGSQINHSESAALLNGFWSSVTDNISKININNHFKTQELPLARIKKIMKLDEDVKMISAEAPVLFAKACEIFIAELSIRAWHYTEENKRRTLQKNDVSQAVAKNDQFDFLIDIVPRDEIKPAKREDNIQRASLQNEPVQYFFQVGQQPAQQQPATVQLQTAGGQIINAQPLQLANGSQMNSQGDAQPQVIQLQSDTNNAQAVAAGGAAPIIQTLQQPQQSEDTAPQESNAGTQVFQQVVTPGGEVMHMPIQLTAAQLQTIQAQMQGKQPGEPIIIQTGTEQEQPDPTTEPLFQLPLSSENDQLLSGEDQTPQTLTIKGER